MEMACPLVETTRGRAFGFFARHYNGGIKSRTSQPLPRFDQHILLVIVVCECLINYNSKRRAVLITPSALLINLNNTERALWHPWILIYINFLKGSSQACCMKWYDGGFRLSSFLRETLNWIEEAKPVSHFAVFIAGTLTLPKLWALKVTYNNAEMVPAPVYTFIWPINRDVV